MRRDGTNHTRDFKSLVCAYGYPVVEHRLIPPAANGGKTHRTIGDAVAHLKGQGMQILATHLSDNAVILLFKKIEKSLPYLFSENDKKGR